MNTPPEFWRTKTLAQMTPEEWESLCDGCGKCCLHKIAQPQGPALKTCVACHLLDSKSCRCKNYARRSEIVRNCVVITPENIESLTWLPNTCAYRLLAAGDDLPAWHPLISNDPESVHQAGISVRGRCISERNAGRLEDYVIP